MSPRWSALSELTVTESRIPGLLRLAPVVHTDDRGSFVKTFQKSTFDALGLPQRWPEQYFSRSNERVIRGLHFQTPPAEHDKLVYCVQGAAYDVVVDLRVGSPTYGEVETLQLDSLSWTGVVIPSGLAHGFAALVEGTIMSYATSTEYDAARDEGVRWDSVGVTWPFDDPIVSPRDASFPTLADFKSPFTFVS